MYLFIHWLENHQLTCPYKKYFGIECAGCGLQTSFIELLKGNIYESIKIYPPLLPIILMFMFLVLHLKFNFKHGAIILKIIFIFTCLLILINYIYKLINKF